MTRLALFAIGAVIASNVVVHGDPTGIGVILAVALMMPLVARVAA